MSAAHCQKTYKTRVLKTRCEEKCPISPSGFIAQSLGENYKASLAEGETINVRCREGFAGERQLKCLLGEIFVVSESDCKSHCMAEPDPSVAAVQSAGFTDALNHMELRVNDCANLSGKALETEATAAWKGGEPLLPANSPATTARVVTCERGTRRGHFALLNDPLWPTEVPLCECCTLPKATGAFTLGGSVTAGAVSRGVTTCQLFIVITLGWGALRGRELARSRVVGTMDILGA